MTDQYMKHPTLPETWLDSQGRAVRADRSLACPNGCDAIPETSEREGLYCPSCNVIIAPRPTNAPERSVDTYEDALDLGAP